MAVSAVFVFFCMHMLIGVVMVTIGGIYHINIMFYSGLSREDINSVPSLTIAVGILIIIFMSGSCFIRNMYNKEGYIMMSLLLLMIQLAAGIHGIVKVSDKNGTLNNALQKDMKDDIAQFYARNSTGYIYYLIRVQKQCKCCGVEGPGDYDVTRIPASCCPDQNNNATYCTSPEHAFQDGCAPKVYERVMYNMGIVAYVTIVLSVVQIFGTLYITVNLIGMDPPLSPGLNYHNF